MFPLSHSAARAVWPASVTSTCIALVLLAAPWSALAVPPLSLDQATRLAVERAPLLAARRSAVRAAQQEQARAGALPDPMLAVGIDNLPVTGGDAFDFGVDEMTMKKVGIRQDIPARAKREARSAFAAREIDQAQASTAAERLLVQRAAADAWIAAWTADQVLHATRQSREQAQLAADLALARMRAGGPVTDVLATKGFVLSMDSAMDEATAGRTSAQATLSRWVGDGPFTLDEAPDFKTLPLTESQLLAQRDRFGPLVTAASRVETAAAAVDLARSEKSPDWSVGAFYGQREGGRSDMFSVEVGIGLPLFTRSRQDRGIAARQADYDTRLAERDDAEREQVAALQAGFAAWQSLQRQIEREQQALLPLAHDRSTTALAGYRGGGGLQPWLDARRDERDAQVAHAQKRGALARAWAALAFLLPLDTQP